MRLASKVLSIFIAALLFCPVTFAYANEEACLNAQSPITTNQKENGHSKEDRILATASSKTTLVKKGTSYYGYSKGRKLKRVWSTIKGKKYYFKKDGKAAKGPLNIKGTRYVFDSSNRLAKSKKTSIVTIGKRKYIADKNGIALSGWQVIAGKLYFSSKSGKCAKSKAVDKIPLTSKFYADPANKRTKVMIEAKKVISKITDDSMTQYQKIDACFEYVLKFPWKVGAYPPSRKSGWQINWAYHTLKVKYNNCWGFAASFCALVKALGEDPYIVHAASHNHLWARINGRYWDNVYVIKDGDAGSTALDDSKTFRFW